MRGLLYKGAFALILAGVASAAGAQSTISFWFNKQGSAIGDNAGDISITAGGTVTLSMYFQVTGNGGAAIHDIGGMLGYTQTSSGGGVAGTAGAAANGLTFNSTSNLETANWGPILSNLDGGSYTTVGGVRPEGRYIQYDNFPGGTPTTVVDGTSYHFADVTLNVSGTLSAGTILPIYLPKQGVGVPGDFSCFYTNSNFSNVPATADYIRNLKIVAAPEPATMAALGFGALALLRRRRK